MGNHDESRFHPHTPDEARGAEGGEVKQHDERRVVIAFAGHVGDTVNLPAVGHPQGRIAMRGTRSPARRDPCCNQGDVRNGFRPVDSNERSMRERLAICTFRRRTCYIST